MRESTRNFLVGLTSIIALLGLAYILFNFGELDAWVHPRYAIMLETDDAQGLRPGSPVDYNGVPVGVVDDISWQGSPDDPAFPIRIRLLIDETTRIPRSVEPVSISPLIGGGARLQLRQPPSSTQPASSDMFSADRSDNLFKARINGGGMFEQASTLLDEQMKPLMAGLDSFNELSATYLELGKNLNAMLKPQSPDLLAGGDAPNLRTAVAKLNQVLDDVRESLALARQWLDDEQIRTDARAAISKARELIDKATTAVDRYSQLAEAIQTDAGDVRNRLLPVIDNLAATLEDVRRLTKLANEGTGTVGLMLTNPDLYNSLNDAAVRLERTLTDAQLLIQKIKAEGLPLKF